MALPINNPRAAVELAKEFAIKGGIHLLLDEVIMPVRVLSAPAGNPAFALTVVPAVAAQFGQSTIANGLPVGSGLLIEVYRVIISAAVALSGTIRVPLASIGALVGVTEEWQDRSIGANPTAVVSSQNAAAAVVGTDVIAWSVPAGGMVAIDLDVKLTPFAADFRNRLVVVAGTVNIAYNVAWMWREPAPEV